MDQSLMHSKRGSSPSPSPLPSSSSSSVIRFKVVKVMEEEEEAVESYPEPKRMNLGTDGGGGGEGGRGAVAPLQLQGGCQVERCEADLSYCKRYHQRHKVCDYHAKAQFVIVGGLRQRFCQQCSRFHDLSEFDDAKRSCRRRLAGHNERRRKNFSVPGRDGGVTRIEKNQCGEVGESGRSQMGFV